jgi:hypothetical protein
LETYFGAEEEFDSADLAPQSDGAAFSFGNQGNGNDNGGQQQPPAGGFSFH